MFGPILVFDSGIGGLSILNEIRQVLPDVDYCYLFDNARLPYGELNEKELIDGCVKLISLMVAKIDASIVVVACNSASTLILTILRERLSIPVVGVVPAIKPAAECSRRQHIGLLATPGTIKRPYTHELIRKFASDCKVELFGSSELVMLAEQKIAGHALDTKILHRILTPIKTTGIDTLVLGCTHFPILKEEIQTELGDNVLLLDSGKAIAARVQGLVASQRPIQAQESKTITSLSAYYTMESLTTGLSRRLADDGFASLTRFHIS